MGTGYADIDNPLFFKENAMMLLGGGKDVSEKLRNYVDGHYKSWFDCHINDLYMQIFINSMFIKFIIDEFINYKRKVFLY